VKKLCIWFTLILVLFMFTSASAATKTSHKSTGGFGTGKFAIGGNLGYSIGFGNAFKEYSYGYYSPYYGDWGWKIKNKLSLSFGAKFKYKINPKFSLGGILEYQGGSVDVTRTGGYWGGGASGSYHWTNLLGSIIYNLTPQQKNNYYLAGGLGLYMGSGTTDLGIHMGGGVEHFFQPDLSLDGGARFHIIFTSGNSTTYLNIYAGVNYYFGE
jgi:hypothetical protein